MDNEKLQNDIEKLKSAYSNVSLSLEERVKMKRDLFAKIDQPSPIFNFSFYTKIVSTAFIAVMIFTTPVVFAAQNSLPGDLLYNFKTNINEEAVGIFVPQQDKIEYHKKLLARRAYEIKTLSDKGDLNNNQIDDVEDAIKGSVSEIITPLTKKKKTEKEIVKDHQDVMAVLEFSQKIVKAKNSKDSQSKIDEVKVAVKESMLSHVKNISNPTTTFESEENQKYFGDLIADSKTEIEKYMTGGTSSKANLSENVEVDSTEMEEKEKTTEEKMVIILDKYSKIAEKNLITEIEILEKND